MEWVAYATEFDCHSSEGHKYEIKVSEWLVSDEDVLVNRLSPFPVSSYDKERKELGWGG